VAGKPNAVVFGLRGKVYWMSKSVEDKEYLVLKEVAKRLHRSTDWVYDHVAKDCPDPLPCHRLGRGYLFDPDEIDRYIESHRVQGSAKLLPGDGIA